MTTVATLIALFDVPGDALAQQRSEFSSGASHNLLQFRAILILVSQQYQRTDGTVQRTTGA